MVEKEKERKMTLSTTTLITNIFQRWYIPLIISLGFTLFFWVVKKSDDSVKVRFKPENKEKTGKIKKMVTH